MANASRTRRGSVTTPSIVRRGLSIPPAATLLTQILAGAILRVLGVLLAVPLLAVGIVLVRELYSYGLLGLRGYPVPAALPDPAPTRPERALPGPRARRRRGRKGG